ncbi:FHA domain-containing protein [Streptomyces sp. HNM0663]|uniref:FHA domain-containing protein n=1 Tax=Streptomyces chengmaiensis TaxID=3040919 RepID=A0ABT6HZV4_9ACTN|nr:FHA domain-containing protein [Streptomyces chengmaiensis]MDH2393970.1 FHA domain-containing protein [Streptomyces chengmaiensis]
MPTCPNGHQSGSDDWCEVCGHRMAGPGAPAGGFPPPPEPGYGYPGPGDPHATQQAELCPQCRTPREAAAPFCEECRYNFLTQTATSYTPAAPPQSSGLNLPPGFQSPPPGQPQPAQQPQPAPPVPPPGPGPQGQQPPAYDYHASRPSQLNRPAEPLSPTPAPPPAPGGYQQHGAPPAPQAFQQPQHTGGGDDWVLQPPQHQSQPQHQPQQAPPAPQHGPQGHQVPQGHHAPQGHQAPQGHHAPQGQHGPQGQHPAPSGWTAVIGPDREYFFAMMQRSGPEAEGLNLPGYSPEQHLPLTGAQITVGRRRHSTGESPDIDLSVPPEDPGVSHQHAVLVHQPDGSWAVVDQNSTNGTTLNGAEEPIQPYVPVPLNDGDRVHVGAWTTITIRRG